MLLEGGHFENSRKLRLQFSLRNGSICHYQKDRTWFRERTGIQRHIM